MLQEKKHQIDATEKDLIVEELTQRYNQYRWEDETRTKFINFYFILYLAFWALVRYLFEHNQFLQLFPFANSPNTQYALVFLAFGILGTFWLISINSFRTIQILEGRTIYDIKKLSPYLINKVRYPFDKRIPKTNKLFFSTTPMVFIVLILNQIIFILSFHFFKESGAIWYKNISFYFNIISYISIIYCDFFWRPKESSIENRDFDKIW